MLNRDSTTLAKSLNTLGEIFGKKVLLSEKAARVWFQALQEFSIEDVERALQNWPRWNRNFPTPAEIHKILNDSAIEEREQIARNQAKENRAANQPTDQGRAALRELVRAVRKSRKRSGLEYWLHQLETSDPASNKSRNAIDGIAALKARGRVRMREPGEDEIEFEEQETK